MITRRRDSGEPAPVWKKELADAFTDPVALLEFLGLGGLAAAEGNTANGFPMKVPRSFARRMRHGDPADPLLLQVLPRAMESLAVPGYVKDPVGDAAALHPGGLIRKYRGRALLVTTGACAVHCRYCFRRHFPYREHSFRRDRLDILRREIAADDTLTEVILSGGDPLALDDSHLGVLLDLFARSSHIQRVRIHTRMPVVLPSRICDSFARMLAEPRNLSLVIVLHINHAREIDVEVAQALELLGFPGITLLNQAVLLRGVNDSGDAQVALAEACFAAGVMPYYLHMLDPVDGAAHFEVSEASALAIARELRTRLPGYLVPRLVRESPGATSKTPLPGTA